MLTMKRWPIILALLIVISKRPVKTKIFERCELAKILKYQHKLDLSEVAQWVCIAQYSSDFNTELQARGPAGGSHGLFQISDVYWCSPPGAGCNIPCHKLRDDNLSDDISCAKRIYEEHQRISGDGYTAWIAYQKFCKINAASYIQDCFSEGIRGYNSYQNQLIENFIEDNSPKKLGKVYGRCELATELYYKHKMPMDQIATWICIVQHESLFNTAAVGRLNADGSTDHGLFQISDLYWCSNGHYRGGGKACKLSCDKLLDDDITDDIHCVKRIFKEHTAISGNGFNAWSVYKPYCQNQHYDQVASCFQSDQQKHHKAYIATVNLTSNKIYSAKSFLSNTNPFLKRIQQSPLNPQHNTPIYQKIFKSSSSPARRRKGKVYTRCSLAKELYFKHNFPIQDIPTWVCIAEHESQFNTDTLGRSNADGSTPYGLFQISDRYWCSHDSYESKACNLPCEKLLDEDLRDDVECIKIIHNEHTEISGDGFNAWPVYQSHCQNINIHHIKDCFEKNILEPKEISVQKPTHNIELSKERGKVYTKCELAQELYQKHHMPMEQVPTWVCIAQHQSALNTAAVGRLNADGSANYGLFQISDLYWCSQDQYGGKACDIPCDKLRDTDISDDVRCIKIIYEEHSRLSGDGFNAWTVYQPHCKHVNIDHIKECFDGNILEPNEMAGRTPSNNVGTDKERGKIYTKCELARELYREHQMPMGQIPTWVCIAKHESSFNTAAVGRLNADGSADHGLFQISDLYWCSHNRYGGKACNIPCHKLLDTDISDDVECIKVIYEEHTRLSGDGFNAWTVYQPYCQNRDIGYIKDCFDKDILESNEISLQKPTHNVKVSKERGKVYTKCELAQELYQKYNMPMEQVPTWVCIAQHQSAFNTAAVGRLNADSSANYGLFQISDLFWCSHDQYGGKACNIPCDKLRDTDISDDVRCIKIIYEEHSRLSGVGFNAWTVYQPHCKHVNIDHIKECFDKKILESNELAVHMPTYNTGVPKEKGKVYKKCELAQELYRKHRMPMEQIPTWVCIAQHESLFNTAAVGRLNADGSADHGLFQISDLYWCAHNQYGGKACNLPCHKLLDTDISDDVKCIKIIYEEHTRLSGDGFNAWTVYKPHCRNTRIDRIRQCFTEEELEQDYKQSTSITTNPPEPQHPAESITPLKGKTYTKCELAQELLNKYEIPMEQIPTWVCIAQHESAFNTAAVGRLNDDGSINYGLFQISDLYWCSNEQHAGKACNIPCHKLLDSDLTDDIRCIKIIHDEHTRLSGDGFNAWATYKPYCRNRKLKEIRTCFTTITEINNATVTPAQSSFQYSPFTQTTPIYRPEIKRKYLNSNEFRTTTTQTPKTVVTQFQNTSWTTTSKPKTLWTTTTAKMTETTKPPQTTTTKQVTTATWNRHDQKYTNNAATKQTGSTLPTKLYVPTTLNPEHHTWRNEPNLETTTTKKQLTKSATTIQKSITRNHGSTAAKWHNYGNTATEPIIREPITSTRKPTYKTTMKATATTQKPTHRTTNNWWGTTTKHDKEVTKATTIKPATTARKPTYESSKREPTTTIQKPTHKTTNNWWDTTIGYKTTTTTPKTKHTTTTTTRKRTHEITKNKPTATTVKPTYRTTNNWWDTTTRHNKATTEPTTQKPTTTTRKPTHKTTSSRWSTITKATTKTTKNPTSIFTPSPSKATTNLMSHMTTVRRPVPTTLPPPKATNSRFSENYETYKHDPFSHPFFAKVKEQIKLLRGNIPTTKPQRFNAT